MKELLTKMKLLGVKYIYFDATGEGGEMYDVSVQLFRGRGDYARLDSEDRQKILEHVYSVADDCYYESGRSLSKWYDDEGGSIYGHINPFTGEGKIEITRNIITSRTVVDKAPFNVLQTNENI